MKHSQYGDLLEYDTMGLVGQLSCFRSWYSSISLDEHWLRSTPSWLMIEDYPNVPNILVVFDIHCGNSEFVHGVPDSSRWFFQIDLYNPTLFKFVLFSIASLKPHILGKYGNAECSKIGFFHRPDRLTCSTCSAYHGPLKCTQQKTRVYQGILRWAMGLTNWLVTGDLLPSTSQWNNPFIK